MSEQTIGKSVLKTKSLTALLAVIAAVALPQVFHAVGLLSGTGAAAGTAFLPMHIPVLLAGLLGGPVVGLVTGLLSPVISYGLSGMPAMALLPFMVVELAGYGLAGGLLSKTKLPVFAQLVLAQLAGRAVRGIAILIAIYGLGSGMQAAQIWNVVLTGLPGILLQWALIPLLLYRLEGLKKTND